MLKKIFEISGFIEKTAKVIAYSNNSFKETLKRFFSKKKKKRISKNEINLDLMPKIYEYIDSLGIKHGDILIVHSSMEGLKAASPNPDEIINYLLNLIGTDGTLVFPTFPIINLKNIPGKIQTYNPKKTLCWTGALPNAFLKREGVVRSLFPYNTLAALGPRSSEMMNNNLEDDVPHGLHSSWYYCVQHSAKILYLGIDIAECNTVLHVADDVVREDWPVQNWYESREYRIVDEEDEILKTIYVCSPFWTKYNICYNYTAKLKKLGFLQETNIGGVQIGFTKDSKVLMDYVIDNARKGKIRYLIPKKYYRVKR